MGRTAASRWGPRRIDLDILLYDNLVLDSSVLFLPHPHLLERSFAFLPSLEIRPDWIHPLAGKTLAELASSLRFCTACLRLEGPSPGALFGG
jgi:2-amino-4-hydroxy-6-hydroxymethyldihydropteridine diphosphokinase